MNFDLHFVDYQLYIVKNPFELHETGCIRIEMDNQYHYKGFWFICTTKPGRNPLVMISNKILYGDDLSELMYTMFYSININLVSPALRMFTGYPRRVMFFSSLSPSDMSVKYVCSALERPRVNLKTVWNPWMTT